MLCFAPEEIYMAQPRARHRPSLIGALDQPLIGIILEENGREVVRYFADEDEADLAMSGGGVQEALALAGAWKDLDAEDALDELDRIRHAAPPTPPIDLPERSTSSNARNCGAI